jgi:carbon-monoxide dehydrogenase large subunit
MTAVEEPVVATHPAAAAPQGGGGRFVGTRRLRREDAPLLSGEARFVDDLAVPGALHLAFVRSPVAHGRIVAVGLDAARSRPGVVAAFSGADLREAWSAPMPCAWPVTADMKAPEHRPLAVERVNHVGDAVAVVVARTAYEAADAASEVVVEYDPLPPVLDLERALRDGDLVHPELGTNVSYVWELSPDPEALRRAFSQAAHVVSEHYVQQRLIPSAIEPRGVVAVPEPFGGDLTVYSATQIPHVLRTMLAVTTGVAESKLRVVAPYVGGGFGSKLNVYAEELVCVALARRLGRAVSWTEERMEAAQATVQGRGQLQHIELAADASGKLLGVRAEVVADMGAYLQLVTPGIPLLGAFLYHGCYDAPAYAFRCTGVFTTKTPTDAYRGAGRPEATYAIERAMDELARRVGVDPAEIRRRNFIAPERFPYDSAAGLTFDSGDYGRALERALELARVDEVRAEQASRRAAGSTRHLGVGLSSYVEMCGLAPSRVLGSLRYAAGGWESATVRVLPTGKVQAVTGSSPHGQSHETSWSMIVADRLGVDPDDVEVLHSDTAVAPLGMDTYGSRSLSVGGTAVALAADKVVDKARRIAAHQLEVADEDLVFEGGSFSVRGSPDRSIGIGAVAFEAFSAHNLPEGVDPFLEASVSWDPPNFTFPFGTHVAVVEVDEETGLVRLVSYAAVDDCGNQVNPMVVEGQIHGGVAQGVAQALWEEAVYDAEGNLLTSTLADYLVPSAAEFPSFRLDHTVTPSASNPLGVKGIGEAGTIAATPAVINAVVDALSHLGVTDIEMPATPERVWSAIGQARSRTGVSPAGQPGTEPGEERP